MNQLSPYAAFFMRLAVGGVFYATASSKFTTACPQWPVPPRRRGAIRAVWAVCSSRSRRRARRACCWGSSRGVGACMAVEMVVAILAVQVRVATASSWRPLLLRAHHARRLGRRTADIAIGLKKGL